ncbi:hypothetical protein DPMN_033216 [Dreissena polymorpha]|uniref:Uncharacterized protein n=1 Tax=Dreissena polymorpha TaxID=45954 RepID=A0A9D4M395_DREPO|nr:hypothetical protein DPMN_033216 [Dreissena polymorpha]
MPPDTTFTLTWTTIENIHMCGKNLIGTYRNTKTIGHIQTLQHKLTLLTIHVACQVKELMLMNVDVDNVVA